MLYSITVIGKSGKKYSFNFEGHPDHVEGWVKEGFIIDEIHNVIPDWVPLSLVPLWCFFQDLLK